MTNAARQLYARMVQATSGGANIEPTEAPMLYTPPASPRSFAGNHSAVAFIPAGLAEPSLSPRSPRSQANAGQLLTRACAILTSDQETANIANPTLRPSTSSTYPQMGWAMMAP